MLDDLTSRGAPIDSFGVGTELVTSRDDPALSGIYKLVSCEARREDDLSRQDERGKANNSRSKADLPKILAKR